MIIPEDTYKLILDNVINVCTDVCLKYQDRYLLICRTEEPCKGVFWPIGGRIHKGESAEDAARRKILEEIGVVYTAPLIAIGYYEDTYTENSFATNTNYSTISIVFEGDLNLDNLHGFRLDNTSNSVGLFEFLPERFKIRKFTS